MNNIKVNHVSLDTAWEIFWKAWAMAKVNYTLALIMVAIYVSVGLLSGIPAVGPIIGGLAGCLLPIGMIMLAKDWENNQASSFQKFMDLYKNKNFLQTFVPVLVVNFLLSLTPLALGGLSGMAPGQSIAYSIVTFPISVALGLVYGLFYFHPKIEPGKAFSLAFSGVIKNIFPFCVAAIIMGVLSLLTMLLLVIPFFLVTMPILVSYNYLWYRVIFEDLVLENSKEEPLL